MKSNAITPAQREVLKILSVDHSDEFAREIKEVLTKHFLAKIDAETDRLWNEGVLNQEKLDEIMEEDLHKTWRNNGAARS